MITILVIKKITYIITGNNVLVFFNYVIRIIVITKAIFYRKIKKNRKTITIIIIIIKIIIILIIKVNVNINYITGHTELRNL